MKPSLPIALVVLCGGFAFAAESPTLAVGSRVRVTAPEAGLEPLVATVVGFEPGAILVREAEVGSELRIPVAPATRLEVSAGRTSRAGRGAVVGAAVGGMPGLLMTFGDYNTDEGSPAAVAVLGAATGAAVGAAIGWLVKSERWVKVAPPAVSARVAPVPRGFAVSFAVAWGSGKAR